MRQFRSPGLALVTGLIAVSSLLSGSPARAEGAPVACVLSLNNLANPADAELGKLAAQRLAIALEKYGARVIVSDQRVSEIAAELEGEAPYDRAGRLQLAAKVEAGQVIYGTLFSTRFTKAPKAQGKARLMVMVEAPGTGQVQALSIEGAGPLHKVAKEQSVLLMEALDNAGAQLAAKLGGSSAAAPVVVASAGGGLPAPLLPLVQPTAVVAIPLVTAQEAAAAAVVTVNTPAPVVVDAPGIDRDLEATGLRKKSILSTKTIRTVVGGVLFMALLGLATGGPLGALGLQ